MNRLYRMALTGVILALILSACGDGKSKKSDKGTITLAPTLGGGSGSLQPTPTVTQPAESSGVQATATQQAEPSDVQPTDTPSDADSGPETMANLLNLSALQTDPQELGNATLQSYRLRVEWIVEPKAGSSAMASSVGIEVAHTSDPLAEQIAFLSEEAGLASEIIHIGDKLWLRTGEQWIEMSSDEFTDYDQMLMGLDSATAGLTGDAELVGEENRSGIPVRHYSFDENILGATLGIYSKIQGDVWIAIDGEYVVEYVYTAEDDQATYRWSWEVFDINAAFTIDPPANAQGARDDIPVMPDATDLVSYGAMLSYNTPTDLNAVVEFYTTEMPAFDWTFDEASSMVSDQFALLNFSKDGETANFTLAPEDTGGTAVVIQAGE